MDRKIAYFDPINNTMIFDTIISDFDRAFNIFTATNDKLVKLNIAKACNFLVGSNCFIIRIVQ